MRTTWIDTMPERIDDRARIVCGYRRGPVVGLGDPGDADAVMMLGMHAAAGTKGFMPHTLTSRLASLRVNGRAMSEAELFSAPLSRFGIAPIFFSGCPAACAQANERLPGIRTFAIDKRVAPEDLDARRWRTELAQAAALSLSNRSVSPYCPEGPFHAEITIRQLGIPGG